MTVSLCMQGKDGTDGPAFFQLPLSGFLLLDNLQH